MGELTIFTLRDLNRLSSDSPGALGTCALILPNPAANKSENKKTD
jgi:hypothetical protein